MNHINRKLELLKEYSQNFKKLHLLDLSMLRKLTVYSRLHKDYGYKTI